MMHVLEKYKILPGCCAVIPWDCGWITGEKILTYKYMMHFLMALNENAR